MPRGSSGTYSLPVAPFASGAVADPAAVNAQLADIAAALGDSLSRTGNGAMAAPLKMNGQPITGVASGTASTDVAAVGQVVQVQANSKGDTHVIGLSWTNTDIAITVDGTYQGLLATKEYLSSYVTTLTVNNIQFGFGGLVYDDGTNNLSVRAGNPVSKQFSYYLFHNNGNAYARNGTWISQSDERDKQAITRLSGGVLERLAEVGGWSFTRTPDGRTELGTIAQRLRRAFPELVHTVQHADGPEREAVDYGGLAGGPVMAALGEILARLRALETPTKATG